MSITVLTEDGFRYFDDAYWLIETDGCLSIIRKAKQIAVFAPGKWVGVERAEDVKVYNND